MVHGRISRASVGRVRAPFIGSIIPPWLITVAPMCRVAPISSPSTYRRQTFLSDANVRSALREAIGTLRFDPSFVIEAWVLLPDHIHALWTLPPGDEDFSYRWRLVKGMVTQPAKGDSIDLNG